VSDDTRISCQLIKRLTCMSDETRRDERYAWEMTRYW